MPRSPLQKLKILYLYDYLRRFTDESHGATLRQIQAHLQQNGIAAERKTVYEARRVRRGYRTVRGRPAQ